ncbi:tetratricopeptide repeat-containing sensor histidine kinase [Dyadobacter soli]|nr:histidine kinase dimerization/phosphoacceptor domain -containing protein [Dyadobacter soli]
MKFGNHFLFRPGETASDLKQAMIFAEKANGLAERLNKPAWQADANLLLARINREAGRTQEALPMIEKALAYYKKSGNFLGEGNALLEKRSQYPLSEQNCKERIMIARQAAAAFHNAGSKKDEADALKELGDIMQFCVVDLPEALTILKRSLALYKEVNFKELHGVYDLIGSVYSNLGAYDEAIEYGLLAVKTAEGLGDSTMQLCTIYVRLALTYFQQGDYNLCNHYHQKALNVAIDHKDNSTIAYIVANLAYATAFYEKVDYRAAIDNALGSLEKYGGIDLSSTIMLYSILVLSYDKLGMHAMSEVYLKKLLDLNLDDQSFHNVTQSVLTAAIKHYLATRQYGLARKYLTSFMQVAKQTNKTREVSLGYFWSFQLDSARGNYISAIGHYQNFKKSQDSLYSVQKQKQVATLNVRFDMERKDRELQIRSQNVSLLTKKSALQQELLQKAQTNRNITAAFLGLSVLFLGLLFNRYKTKQRTNLAIAENNRVLQKMVSEREWLVRELHHRVKNNLQTIMSLLESQSVYLRDDALEAIKESQHRVQAMSLIHQKLYLTDNLATIDMSNYIWDLTDYLLESFPGRSCRLSLELDPITLDVGQAIPIGLILNEAITNSLKYAFPNGRDGSIKVVLKKDEYSSKVTLSITDDGIGMPQEYMSGKPGSMGLKLIHGLAGELGGKVQLSGDAGTEITLEFDQRITFGQPGGLEQEMPIS